MLEGFVLGWFAALGWCVILAPIYLVKSAFRFIDS